MGTRKKTSEQRLRNLNKASLQCCEVCGEVMRAFILKTGGKWYSQTWVPGQSRYQSSNERPHEIVEGREPIFWACDCE
jgi:hypothetical protein